MLKKRSLLVLLVILLVSVSIIPLPVSAQDAVTIRMWTHQNDAFTAGYQKLIDAYTTANPNVTITIETFDYGVYIQTLQTALPAGTEADILVMFGTWNCGYASGGRLAAVPESVLTLEEAEELYYEAPLTGFTCPDESGTPVLYGLPQEFNIEYGAVLVNTEMAAEAGIELPDPLVGWASWDDFIADAAQLTEGDQDFMTRAGFHYTAGDGINFMYYSLIKQLGGQFFDETTRQYAINTPEGRAALELMVSMAQEHNLVNPQLFADDVNWVGDAFFTDQAAIGLVGPWVVADYRGDFPEFLDKLTYIRLPSLGDEPAFVADSGWGMVVSVNSQVQEQAWDFIKYATTDPEAALEWNITSGTLPALRQLVENEATLQAFLEPQPWVAPFIDIFPYGDFIGHLPDRDLLFYDITLPHITAVMMGLETIDEALVAMENEANGSS
jgi:multiple sugar transport system substrate-binding protein